MGWLEKHIDFFSLFEEEEVNRFKLRISFWGILSLILSMGGFAFRDFHPLVFPAALILLGFGIREIHWLDIKSVRMPVQMGLPEGRYVQYRGQTYWDDSESKESVFGWGSFLIPLVVLLLTLIYNFSPILFWAIVAAFFVFWFAIGYWVWETLKILKGDEK